MTDNEDKTTSKDSSGTQDPSRRKFLKNTGVATGGVVGGALLGGLIGNPFKSEETTAPEEKGIIDYSETQLFFKRKADFDVLSMATERILPEDETGPGAIELGVPYFIDKQLAGPWGENSKMYMDKPFKKGEMPMNHREVFLQGVRKIDEVSKKEYDQRFPELEEEQQNKILELFEQDKVKMGIISSAYFFTKLIQSTLEGAYSDPMYGGNKGMKGWKMKEFPGPRMSHLDRLEDDFETFQKMPQKSLKDHA